MTQTRFRVRIDGSWSAKEMADLFQSCETIYGQLATLHSTALHHEHQAQSNAPSPIGNADGRDKLLKVTSISYGSPGWADLLGAGELTGHLKEFILGLITLVIERKDRDQARQLRAAQIDSAALENYSKQLELLDRAFDLAKRQDLNDAQRTAMLHQILQASRPLGKAVADRRLLSVEDLPEEK